MFPAVTATVTLTDLAALLQQALRVSVTSGSITLHFHQGQLASVETRTCAKVVPDLTNR